MNTASVKPGATREIPWRRDQRVFCAGVLLWRYVLASSLGDAWASRRRFSAISTVST